VSARRPLLTATAAGTVLFALWFVPSANATVEEHHTAAHSQGQSRHQTQSTSESLAELGNGSRDLSLADTGSVDTTPYLVGGPVFLGIGAAMVSYTMRRSGSAAL
jgi:hypothetical protein